AGAAPVQALDDPRRETARHRSRRPRDRHPHGRAGHAGGQAGHLELRHPCGAGRGVLRLEELPRQGPPDAQPAGNDREDPGAGADLLSVTWCGDGPVARDAAARDNDLVVVAFWSSPTSAAKTKPGSRHQAFAPGGWGGIAVRARPATTRAATCQSSPITKSYQNAPNALIRFMSRPPPTRVRKR